MVFSDNVPVEQEVALKRCAAERGLLVMGPDCGTAVVGGLGLGFANVVAARPGRASSPPRAPAASSCSRCSTTPASASPRRSASAAATCPPRSAASPPARRCAGSTPTPRSSCRAGLQAAGRRGRRRDHGVRRVAGHAGRARAARRPAARTSPPRPRRCCARLGRDVPAWPVRGSARRRAGGPASLHGLFVGGTHWRSEAADARRPPLARRRTRATRSSTSATTPTPTGRAHPMIDPTLRLEHLARVAADPRHRRCSCSTSCSATAPSPTRPRSLAPGDRAASASRWWSRSSAPPHDPQGLDRQVARAGRGRRRGPPVQRRRHPPRPRAAGRHADEHRPPRVVTVGADLLADAVAAQAVDVTRVDWRPPMPGTEADLATVAADPLRADANARALARDARRAGDARRRRPGLARCSASSPASSCTPARRSPGTAPPARSAGALMGGAALEGLVDDPEDAVALFEAGTARLARAVPPPRARSARWPAWSPRACGCSCSRTPPPGARTHCSLNEGLGKVLRYGAYSPEVLTRLRWMGDVLGPLLQTRRRAAAGPVDVTGDPRPRCCRWATRPTTATAPAP